MKLLRFTGPDNEPCFLNPESVIAVDSLSARDRYYLGQGHNTDRLTQVYLAGMDTYFIVSGTPGEVAQKVEAACPPSDPRGDSFFGRLKLFSCPLQN